MRIAQVVPLIESVVSNLTESFVKQRHNVTRFISGYSKKNRRSVF